MLINLIKENMTTTPWLERGYQPFTHVSWIDTKQYLEWLSNRAGINIGY